MTIAISNSDDVTVYYITAIYLQHWNYYVNTARQ